MGSERYAGADRAVSEAGRRAETSRLLARARASTGADRRRYENDVVRLNLAVAVDVARRYRGRGIPDDDLDQVACLGLVKAVRGFDVTVGEDFLSFAVPTVRGEVRRYFRDAGWTIRPPRAVQEAQARVIEAEAELAQRLGRVPGAPELAVHLDVPLALVLDALGAGGCFAPVSLDVPPPGGPGADHRELLGELDPAFAVAEARLAVRPLLGELSERERTIVELRYFQDRTQAEIGAAVGVSQEQVSRLISAVLARLRRRLAAA